MINVEVMSQQFTVITTTTESAFKMTTDSTNLSIVEHYANNSTLSTVNLNFGLSNNASGNYSETSIVGTYSGSLFRLCMCIVFLYVLLFVLTLITVTLFIFNICKTKNVDR